VVRTWLPDELRDDLPHDLLRAACLDLLERLDRQQGPDDELDLISWLRHLGRECARLLPPECVPDEPKPPLFRADACNYARAVLRALPPPPAPSQGVASRACRDNRRRGRPRVSVADANALMREALEDQNADTASRLTWTAEEWSRFIRCSGSTIVKTATWKQCEPARERRKAEGHKRRR
jgi:hypothetical protein